MLQRCSATFARLGKTAATLGLLGLLLPLGAVAQTYEIINLGTLGGSNSGAQDVDQRGRIVGWAELSSGERHAFHYSAGTMTDLGTLVGGSDSIATGISANGLITGSSGINAYGPQFEEATQGFIVEAGALRAVGELYCPCTFNRRYGNSEAQAVNDRGQVVGHAGSVRGDWLQHAFLWENGGMLDMAGPGNWSESRAYDINNAGQVVGDYAPDSGLRETGAAFDRRAFLWQNGSGGLLGTLPGHSSSSARAINANGEVAGWSANTQVSNARAFFWSNGLMQDLGLLPNANNSQALDVNDGGYVVGWSGNADQSTSRAFIWHRNIMLDLNALLPLDTDWLLIEASAINNSGQIVGTGLYQGELRAFLLQPDSAGSALSTRSILANTVVQQQAGRDLSEFSTSL